jgi:GDPmannose 4,6-dehydratase
MSKTALITGITGQDGSYLAEFLLSKGYEVHGIKRRASSFNTDRINEIYEDVGRWQGKFHLHYGDLTDGASLINIINSCEPDEIYNLAAQSHVAVSFQNPIYTSDVNALGTLRILEAIRTLGLSSKTRFYQASTSELYGRVLEDFQNEDTPFYPQSPYAISKLFSYWITKNYRDAYGLFGCNGILFNHESPRRGETFVTRKITRGLSRLAVGLQNKLIMGNLNALRDWGHAQDFVEMQWLMLQQDHPSDYVIATGEQHTVRQFIEWSASRLGLTLEFRGEGANETGIVVSNDGTAAPTVKIGQTIVAVSEKYFRPTEVETLLGNAQKACVELGWKPTRTAQELCHEMIDADFSLAKKEKIIAGQ